MFKSVALALMAFAVALPATADDPYVLVSNHAGGNSVSKYDLTGNWQGHLVAPGSGGLASAVGVRVHQGDLLVVSEGTGQVLRYNLDTGAFIDAFIDDPLLLAPGYMEIGPDGSIYVDSVGNNSVRKYDPTTGAFISIAATGGSLSGPDGLLFLPSGELLVSSYFNHAVKRYDPTTGNYLGDFINGGGLLNPLELRLVNGESEIHVVSQGPNTVRAYNANTGAFIATSLAGGGLNNPIARLELPNSDLLVSSYSNSRIVRFQSDGTVIGNFALGAAQGLTRPTVMILVTPPICEGDINNDNIIDTADLGILIGAFGTADPIADINNDNIVDTADLGILIAQFGNSCE